MASQEQSMDLHRQVMEQVAQNALAQEESMQVLKTAVQHLTTVMTGITNRATEETGHKAARHKTKSDVRNSEKMCKVFTQQRNDRSDRVKQEQERVDKMVSILSTCTQEIDRSAIMENLEEAKQELLVRKSMLKDAEQRLFNQQQALLKLLQPAHMEDPSQNDQMDEVMDEEDADAHAADSFVVMDDA